MDKFLAKLEKLNLFLVPQNGDLILKGKKNKLTQEEVQLIRQDQSIVAYIKENKQALIQYLTQKQAQKAIYKLSPLQEGMLFHYLYNQDAQIYIEQFIVDLPAGVNIPIFRKAWSYVFKNHSILRTSFIYDKAEIPLQCVHPQVELPILEMDFSHFEEANQQEQLNQLIKEDISKGFELTQPPLMRIHLVKMDSTAYKMILTYHHILLDGWSLPVIVEELLVAYDAYLRGQQPPSKKVDQYEDYIQYIQTKDVYQEEKFWKNYLHEVEDRTLLPFVSNSQDRNKGEATPKESMFHCSAAKTDQLRAFAKSNNLTVNTLIQGAWSLLLSHYTNKPETLFGVTVSGRPTDLEQAEEKVGLYINALPLRSTIRKDQTVLDWLKDIQEGHVASWEYQYTGLNTIQDWVGITGDLFDSLVVFENYPVQEVLDEQDWSLKLGAVEVQEQTNYLLTIVVGLGKQLKIKFLYNDTLLKPAYIDLIKGHFEQVLDQLVDQQNRQVADLMILSAQEQEQILAEFNPAAVSYPKDQTIVSLFEQQTKQTPKAIAVDFNGQTLSYQELNEQADLLARYLQKQGVQAESLVTILLEPSLEMIVGILGVLKAGGAYVPIDPAYPQDRIDYMLSDTATSITLCTQKQKHLLTNTPTITPIFLDQDWPQIEQANLPGLTQTPKANQLAYIIYTSGSTGKPKGVLIEHRNVVRLFKNDKALYDFSEQDVWSLFHSYCFDFSVWEIFGALLFGGKLVIVPSAMRKDPIALGTLINQKGVTVFNQTPGSFYQFQEAYLPENYQTTIRYVIFGGEALNPILLQNWNQAFPACQLINMYGITETTVHVTYKELGTQQLQEEVSNIGKAIPTLHCYVLDQNHNLCPIGVPGELYVAGAGVARGYLNREELTQERFIPDPLNRDQETVYKTGDLARWLPNGDLEYLGRIDNQVKIRGYRIELGEITAVLQAAESVNRCFVLDQTGPDGNKQLVAFVLPETTFVKDQLQAYLRARLPEYMVPTQMIELAQVPLTSNGKVDRKALLKLAQQSQKDQDILEPTSTEEKILVQLWKKLLKLDQVGITHNFFELGGHSLLAMRVVAGIRKELQKEVPIKAIFTYPTIVDLARYLETIPIANSQTRIPVQTRPEDIPLSYAQERLWFIDQFEGSTQYHLPTVLRLHNAIDKEALEEAIKALLERHEVLRTIIQPKDGKPYQQVRSIDDWKMAFYAHPRLAQEEALSAYIQEEVAKAFDLAQDYLLRATLIQCGAEDHVLVLVLHHIASDGWSESILVQELSALYQAQLDQKTATLPTLPIQYADYAIWQRKHFNEEVLTNQMVWWENHLTGVEVLKLPTDYPRPAKQSYRGASQGFWIPAELSKQLKALANQLEVTPFMLFLTTYKVLLYRYSGQSDICVGIPATNRRYKELESLIGFFINTLALRNQLEGEQSFIQLLNQVKHNTLAAFANQDVPFEQIVERVSTDRSLSRSPLFQTMFVMQNNPKYSESAPSDTVVDFAYEQTALQTTQFDLTINIAEYDGSFQLGIEYCTDLFKVETIQRLATHFQELLQQIVAKPSRPIEAFPLLSLQELEQVVVQFNNTAHPFPEHETIIDQFAQQVAKTSDLVAVRFGDETLTYKELDQRSNQLAHDLQANGVKAESLVALCLDRSFEMIIAILGVLKAGGAYVPIDPTYPEHRINYILEDTQAPIVLTVNPYSAFFKSVDSTVIDLQHDWNRIAQASTDTLLKTPAPQDLAYIIYTSGSTGRPKGVMNQHDGLYNRLAWAQDYFHLEAGKSIVLQKTTYCFDVSVWELLWPLLTGAELVFAKPEGHKDNVYLRQLIESAKVSMVHFVPSMLEVFLADLPSGACPELKQVICSGEALKPSQVALFKEKLPHVQLDNLYGPTEAAIDVSYWNVPDQEEPLQVVPIGKPVANTQLYILDGLGNPCGIGIPGELHIGGVQVARGYLNRPNLNEAKFIQDPFSDATNARLYKTGDLVRWLPDGNIEYLGRIDAQVKIRGFRIELGEIENTLQQHPSIQSSVVLAKSDQSGQLSLVAYIVPGSSEPDLKAQDGTPIQAYLASRLPDYMVPAFMVTLEELPLTSNGKVDRKKLLQIEVSRSNQKTYVAPEKELEIALVDIWQQLLQLDKIGITDNFFEIGGHSLLAMRVVSAIRKQLEIEIPVTNLFSNPTIAQLASYLESSDTSEMLPPLVAEPRPTQIPLSYSQERLWFVDQLEGSVHYHQPTILSIEKQLEVSLLEAAFKDLIKRHEVLRTVFKAAAGQSYQEILPVDPWTMHYMDGAEFQREAHLNAFIQQEIDRPFDLSTDYMLRAHLIKQSSTKHILILVRHHISSDGWSESILVNDLMELYQARAENRKAELPELPIQYADYAIWQRKYVTGEYLKNQLAWWKNQLEGIEPLELPTDYLRPAVKSTNGSSYWFKIDKGVAERCKTLALDSDCTLFMALIAAYKTLLYRYTGQEDICIGTPIANRTHAELEPLVGFFTNNLVLRTNLEGTPTFRTLLNRVRNSVLEAFQHQEVPFEQIVDEVQPERNLSHNPIFQVTFAMQNTPEASDLALGGLDLASIPFSRSVSRFDLNFSVEEYPGGIQIAIEYCTDLFSEAKIMRMAKHFELLLEGIVTNPDLEIGKYPLLTQTEEQQLLLEFNDTEFDSPQQKTIIDLFQAQVSKNPSNTAVVFEGKELTYQGLDAISNQLGNYLLSQYAIEANELIAIKLERSELLIAVILGILKSGGAYLPIDPTFPEDRIKYMLDDSGARLIIDEQFLDAFLANRTTFGVDQVPANLQPNQLAYVIYTSGSTGRAKGVEIIHQTVVNEIHYLQHHFNITEKDRVIQTANYVFDPSVEQIFIALLSGATLVMIPRETLLDSELMEKVLINGRITYLHSTPSLLKNIPIQAYEHLRQISSGGELCTLGLARAWAPYVKFVNKYGPTEATITSTTFPFDPTKDTEKTTSLSIGRPLGNVKVYILDTYNQPVPIGVNGEICIGGTNLARGYLNRPDLTREKFIPSPFVPGERIYKTGDLGRWLPDGNMEFASRKDDQVKVRGFRIELGEIESLLQESTLIEKSIVLVKDTPTGDKRLVAYIVPKGKLQEAEIRAFLEAYLPEYMVPSLFVALEELPLTVNGKIDKKALPDPALYQAETAKVEARTDTEKQLAEIWKRILKIDQVGVQDNFFEIGGHSLLAMRLISAIRKEMEREVKVKDIFRFTSLESLATFLDELKPKDALPPITQRASDDNLPLSYAQERLWFIDQLEGSVHYHQPSVLRLKNHLNQFALQQAFVALIDRHEVLRTTFKTQHGQPYQQIISASDWELHVVEGIHFEQEEDLSNYILQEINRPFDLAADYLLKAHLIRVNADEHVLLIIMHHIAADGWSNSILVKELMEFYDAALEQRTPNLNPLPIQYADYALWQRKHLAGDYLSKQLDWWEQHLTGFSPLELPTDYPRPASISTRGDSMGFVIDTELATNLKQLSAQHGATLFMTMLSAFNVLLHRYSGQDQICVGTPLANRDRAEIEPLVGFFINNLVLYNDLSGTPTFSALLNRVKQNTVNAFAHQEVPFEQIVDRVEKDRDLSRSPIFQVVFIMQNTPDVPILKLGDLEISFESSGKSVSRFDLIFSIDELADGMQVGIAYCLDLFDRATIERMAEHFHQLLRSISKNPYESIHRLEILPAKEQQLLQQFSTSSVDYPKGKSLVDLFREQAASTPDNLALVYQDHQLSYKEVDQLTDQIASYLIAKGIKPGDAVAICSNQSLEIALSVWGILKTGACYIPIDHENPADRINFIIQNTKSKLIITNKACASLIESKVGLQQVILDECWEAIQATPKEDLSTPIDPEHLLYIIHTSGSTGMPKGVMLSHQNVIDHLYGFFSKVEFRKSKTFSIMSTMSADLANTVLYGAMISGGTIHLIPKEIYTDANRTHEYFQANSIDFIKLVPSHWKALETEAGILLPNRTIVFGGEVLDVEILEKISAVNPDLEIINHYGPTEVTIGKVCHRVKLRDIPSKTPIGKPFCNTKLYIVDPQMALCPIGVPGELLIGGDGVSKGYINRPDLTENRYIQNPFSDQPDDILYRSGDLIRWLPTGELDFIGRVDDQVKIRGYRIELGEINAILQQSPLVKQSIVLAKKEDTGYQQLVAYMVTTPENGNQHASTQIQEFLKMRLPEYMIPNVLLELDTLPLNANGKIDRRALLKLDTKTVNQQQYIAPRNELEQKLAQIWQDLLQSSRLGSRITSLRLAAIPLLAMRVITSIRKEFALNIPLKVIFQFPTIQEMYDYIALLKASESEINEEESEIIEL